MIWLLENIGQTTLTLSPILAMVGVFTLIPGTKFVFNLGGGDKAKHPGPVFLVLLYFISLGGIVTGSFLWVTRSGRAEEGTAVMGLIVCLLFSFFLSVFWWRPGK